MLHNDFRDDLTARGSRLGVVLLALAILLPASAPAAQALDDDPETIFVGVGRSHLIDPPWAIKGASLIDPEVADVQVLTPTLATIAGKSPGTTDLLLWGEGDQTMALRVIVEVDLTLLERNLAEMMPDAALNITQSGGVTVVSGALRAADQVRQLHEYLEARGITFVDATSLSGVQQVSVQVRVAEVSRTSLRKMGVNLFKLDEHGFLGSVVGSDGGGPINPVSIGVPGGSSALGAAPFAFTATTAVSPAVTIFGGFPGSDLQFFVEALAENQYLRVLAEPNLVALSGEEAKFLAGGEFPIPIVQGGSGDSTAITIDYKEFGIQLAFQPIVLGDSKIRLEVATEVSELSEIGAVQIQGFSVPSIKTRNAHTTVEMRSGQTFAMAGLISEETNARSSRVPGLGDLPVLGPLFRSVRYRSGETELVLLVTASLVEPLSETAFPSMPGSDHVIPNDWDLYAHGYIEGRKDSSISPKDAEWLRQLGLSQLKGPGAWLTYDQATAASTARYRENPEAWPSTTSVAADTQSTSETLDGTTGG